MSGSVAKGSVRVALISYHDESAALLTSEMICQMCTSVESELMRPSTAPFMPVVDCWISATYE